MKIQNTSSDAPPPTSRRRTWRRVGVVALVAAALTTAGVTLIPSAGASAVTSIFDADLKPTVQADPDRGPVELGIKFEPQVSGRVTALKYYQGSADLDVTRATLWSDGKAVSQVSFASTDKVGWRTVQLPKAMDLEADETYVASYHANRGAYPSIGRDLLESRTQNGFVLPAAAGVYAYGSSTTYPKSTYQGSNYLVDVVYEHGTQAAAPAPAPTKAPTTAPAAAPTPTTAASAGVQVLGRSFPSAATTGVPRGTTLSAYTGPCTIQTDDVVIDGKTINCDMRILAQNVKITRSLINGTIYSDSDYFNGSFSLTDSEVRMPQSTGTGIGDVNFTVKRVEVTGGSRSINCAADCTVEDSFLHGQYTDQRGIDHESAIRMGSNSVIRHNHITCDSTPVPPDAGCSAALTGYGDFAVVQKNTIDNNLIDGGPYGSMGYCAYGGSTTGKPFSKGVNNIKFTDNIFVHGPKGKCGIWGPITSFDLNAPGNVWSGNLWDDGKVVPAAN